MDVEAPAPFQFRKFLIRDLRFSLPFVILLAIGESWFSWRGETFMLLLLGYVACLYGLPLLFGTFLLTLMSAKSWPRLLRRVSVQGLILALMAVLWVPCAFAIKGWSVNETCRRGDRIGDALKAHRSRHGAYPDSLAALGPRPVPTVRSDFRYYREGDGYELSFSVGDSLAFSGWARGPAGRWRRVD